MSQRDSLQCLFCGSRFLVFSGISFITAWPIAA